MSTVSLGYTGKLVTREDIKELDDLSRIAVRLREDHCCQMCPKRKFPMMVYGNNSHRAHIVRCAFKSTRWYLPNLLHLCFWCHRWGHENPNAFVDWVIGLIGQSQYDDLVRRSQQKWDRDVEKVRSELQRTVAEFRG